MWNWLFRLVGLTFAYTLEPECRVSHAFSSRARRLGHYSVATRTWHDHTNPRPPVSAVAEARCRLAPVKRPITSDRVSLGVRTECSMWLRSASARGIVEPFSPSQAHRMQIFPLCSTESENRLIEEVMAHDVKD
ncbi:hypothetical protein EI94DRAFT_883027 [Lactarius quietus]|nr:hypothetical protein EI94DRAFT_883027 [Lactarius quietus]